MKYPKLFLTFIFLINCIFLFGQSSANKEFLDSKGTWSLPISSCIKIINYGSSKRIGHGCDFGPRISFKTNKIQPIIAVYKGIVVSVFNVGDVCAAMTRYGDYFITYSQLGVVYVKKGDTLTQGQKIGDLFCEDDDCEIEIILSDTNVKLIDPYIWFKKEEHSLQQLQTIRN